MTKRKTPQKKSQAATRKGRSVSLLFESKADLKRLDAVCESLGIPRNRLVLSLIDGFLCGVDPDGLDDMSQKLAKAMTDTMRGMMKEI